MAWFKCFTVPTFWLSLEVVALHDSLIIKSSYGMIVLGCVFILDTVKCVGEMTFKDSVKNVKLRTDKIIIVLNKKTYVYEFKSLK